MTTEIVSELGRIPMAPNLAATLTRAAEYAGAQSHNEVTLEHLLLALTEDYEAGVVLATSRIDLNRLQADVSEHLGRLPHGQATPPSTAIELRKILEAAAAAAAQSRRRDIDGAIVLAAIVGEGRSVAANILRAHGLSFQDAILAIRTLQSKAAPKQISPAAAETTQPAPTPPPEPGPTANDTLADARQRIEQRQQMRRQTQTAPPQDATVPAAEPPPSAGQQVPAEAPDDGFPHDIVEEEAPAPAKRDQGVAAAPPAASQLPPAREEAQPAAPPKHNWAPQSDTQTAAKPPPRPHRAPPPLPPQPRQPAPQMQDPNLNRPAPAPTGNNENVPRPAAQPGQPPWPDARERTGGQGPAVRPRPQGRVGGFTTAPPANAPQSNAPPRRRPSPSAMIDAGQLVENIPRLMRVAMPVTVEVRIAKSDVKALAEGLEGGGAAYHHEVQVTKAMSVRLRTPEGGFYIETTSPETQWIDNALGLMADDYASWRWAVTPTQRGRRRLQLVVSARTVGADGMVAETALPDQVIDVRVRTNYGRAIKKLAGWTAAAVVGGLLARFGEQAWDNAQAFIKVLSTGPGA